AKGAVKNLEVEFVSKNGRTLTSSLSAVVMEIESEPCVVSFVRDISDRKQAEQLHAHLAAIVQSADDAIFSFDLETRIKTWNPGAERLYGYRADEIVGRKLDTLAPAERVDEIEKYLGQVLQARTMRWDTKRQKKNGTLFDASIVTSPIHDANGAIVGISNIVRDVTQRKQAEIELTKAREQALAASRAKSEFLATMSHEIRTPMTAVIGMADLLWENPLTPEQRGYVRIIRTAGNALHTLIDSILDLSKIEGGHLHLEEIDFDLEELVQSSVETFAFRAHEKGLELVCHSGADVPRALRGDPLRLRQVLGNLIGNAVKFTGQGEVVVRVEKDPDANEAGVIRFSVGDTGIGIPHAETSTVFEPFNQVDSSITRRYGGSGLGLTICKRLVELMGGRIWLESEPGRGSIFYFTVSMRLQPEASRESQAVVGEPSLKELTVLVADDKASQSRVLKELLEQSGAIVTEVADYQGARRELERANQAGNRYNLLLLDDSLVDGNSLDALRQDADQSAVVDAAILMLSSTNLNHDIERARQSGVAYLVKPIAQRELLTTIGVTLMNGHPLPDQRPAETADWLKDQRNLHILLAEDSEDNRVLVQAYLKNTPYQLDVAENGEIAVAKFIGGKYDLVLMDLQMPVMDGYTAVKKIREWERDGQVARTPIVALTAHALKEDAAKSLEAGCDAHVTKPIRKRKLLEAIAEATRNWRDSYEKHVAHVDPELAPLLPRFLERKRKDITAIRDHLEQQDYETVSVLGHNIKGEGGGYGLDALTTIGSSIEEAARLKDSAQLRELVDALATYLEEVKVCTD
ncbi:MAG TPA: response regulator, partial [Candidatus Binataceae bacterium]|nr:response regulator [Candidatus Binataceae bacterium]